MFDSYRWPSTADRPPHFGTSGVDRLIPQLIALGVDVPGGDRFDLLVYAAPPEPAAPDVPLDLSTITPDDMRRLAQDRARDKAAAAAALDELQTIKSELLAGWQTWVTANLDDIIAQLAPAFDKATERVKFLADHGVQPGAGAADLIEMPQEVIAAWLAYRRDDLPKLNRLLAVRIALAYWSHSVPFTNPIKYGVGLVPGRRLIDLSALVCSGTPDYLGHADLRAESSEHFWLRRAASLGYATPAQIEATWTAINGDDEPTDENGLRWDEERQEIRKTGRTGTLITRAELDKLAAGMPAGAPSTN